MNNTNLIEELGLMSGKNFNSKILGWLLNPKESHNLKGKFLEDFLLLMNYRISTFDDVTVETNHNMGYDGMIDILINTKDCVFAIQCSDFDDKNVLGSVLHYKDYLEDSFIKGFNKKIECISLNVGPCGFGGNLNYIKCIRYIEIAEILPQNLSPNYQPMIDKYSEIIQETTAKTMVSNASQEDIKKWKGLNKYGRIIRQIAKYFHLEFSYQIFDTNYRAYAINSDEDLFLLFCCKKECIYAQIRLMNKNSDKFLRIVEQAQNMQLNVKNNGKMAILQEVEIMKNNKKSLEELITVINQSQILVNYQKLYSNYA